MLLAELVLDQASVDWGKQLPLMLHVIFLGESTLFVSSFHCLYRMTKNVSLNGHFGPLYRVRSFV